LEERVQVNTSVFVLQSERKRLEAYENTFIQLFNDKSSADFSFKGVAQAHLFLLVARSEYFEALVRSSMIEAQKSEASIESFS
jgi:hypothetical protein